MALDGQVGFQAAEAPHTQDLPHPLHLELPSLIPSAEQVESPLLAQVASRVAGLAARGLSLPRSSFYDLFLENCPHSFPSVPPKLSVAL